MSSDNEDNISITNDGNVAGDTLADVTTLQGYCEDDSKVLPSDRMRFHMTLSKLGSKVATVLQRYGGDDQNNLVEGLGKENFLRLVL